MSSLAEVVLPDPGTRKPAVLVVEDEVLIRLALADYLQDCAFMVYGAGSAAEAVAVLQAGEFPIDVVLTDVRMPGEMDGFELARWIRRNKPGLPVLITTGDKAKAELAAELCEKNPIIEKPHDFKQVVARIRAAIDGAKATPS